MAAGSGIRIGDAEREAMAASLREHYSQGRLTMDEFQERLDAAFAAKTDVDLAKISADLPQANPYTAPWSPQPKGVGSAFPGRGTGSGGGWDRTGNRQGRGTGFRGTHAWLRVSTGLVVLAAILVAISVSPLAFAPRIVLILLGLLAFLRRIFRWVGGRRRF